MKLRTIICMASLGTFLACTAPSSTTPTMEGESLQADSLQDAIDANAGDTLGDAEEDPSYMGPPRKSDKDFAAISAVWREADANEKEYLANPALLARIKDLVSQGSDGESEGEYAKLSDAEFAALSANELLYYCLDHPEAWSQSCAEVYFEAGDVQGICFRLPYDDEYLSDRQVEATRTRNLEIKQAILDFLSQSQTVSLGMLQMIVSEQMVEAVPSLIQIYKTQPVKDDLILTALVQMMLGDEYDPLLNLDIYKSAIAADQSWMALNATNADKILFCAKKFAAP